MCVYSVIYIIIYYYNITLIIIIMVRSATTVLFEHFTLISIPNAPIENEKSDDNHGKTTRSFIFFFFFKHRFVELIEHSFWYLWHLLVIKHFCHKNSENSVKIMYIYILWYIFNTQAGGWYEFLYLVTMILLFVY